MACLWRPAASRAFLLLPRCQEAYGSEKQTFVELLSSMRLIICKLNAIVEYECLARLSFQHADDDFGSRCLDPERNAASKKVSGVPVD